MPCSARSSDGFRPLLGRKTTRLGDSPWLVVAEELAVEVRQVGIGRLFLAGVEAQEIDIDEGDECWLFSLSRTLLDVAGRRRRLGAVLERGIDGEVAGAFATTAALADEGEDDQVVLLGGRLLTQLRALRMFSLVAGSLLRCASSVPRSSLMCLASDAEESVDSEQVVERLGVGLGVLARQNLRVPVFVDADDDDIGLSLFIGRPRGLGSRTRQQRPQEPEGLFLARGTWSGILSAKPGYACRHRVNRGPLERGTEVNYPGYRAAHAFILTVLAIQSTQIRPVTVN